MTKLRPARELRREAIAADAPWPPPRRDYQLRRGLEHCPACGQVVSPKTRKLPHPETGTCLVRRTVFAYEARGWRQVGTVYAGLITECGGVVERAPAALDPFADDVPESVTSGFYAPNEAVSACEVLANLRLGVTLRRAAIRCILAQPELIAAIDTVKRMSDGNARAFVRDLAWEEHQRMEKEAENAG